MKHENTATMKKPTPQQARMAFASTLATSIPNTVVEAHSKTNKQNWPYHEVLSSLIFGSSAAEGGDRPTSLSKDKQTSYW